MLIIFGFFFLGVLCGFLAVRLRRGSSLPDVEGLFSPVVRVMLWAFGLSLGVNGEIISNLPVLGLTALRVGLMAMAGSILTCWILQRRLSPRSSLGGAGGAFGLKDTLSAMSGSLVTVGLFAVGVLMGWGGWLHSWLDASRLAEWSLWLLIFLVGFSLGVNPRAELLRGGKTIFLVAPVSLVGSLAGGALAGLIPGALDVADSVTVASGMGYYSLSSLMITRLKAAALGLDGAQMLGAVALMCNLIRELAALLFAPLIGRSFGSYALVGAAGVTSVDVTLPAIRSSCGESAVPVALVNGIMLDLSMPVIITLTASL